MDEWVKAQLEGSGIRVDEVLDRMMGSEVLLQRMMKKFLNDPSYGALCAAMEGEDWVGALTAAHTMKGTCGNLSMTELAQLCTDQVALLRADQPLQARARMAQVTEAYQKVVDAIGRCWP